MLNYLLPLVKIEGERVENTVIGLKTRGIQLKPMAMYMKQVFAIPTSDSKIRYPFGVITPLQAELLSSSIVVLPSALADGKKDIPKNGL